MRAVVVAGPGGHEALRLVDVARPAPGPGEVLLRVIYAACNWGDVQKRQGIYPDPIAYPATLGAEVSGTVHAVGKGVTEFRPGQLVAAITGPAMLGGFADFAVVPRSYVIPVPPDMDPRLAPAFPIAGLTAYHLLHTATRLRRGEAVLIHAAAGGVGLALTQLARAAGATVLGTVGARDKAATPLRLGAHRVVAREEEDFVEAAMVETAGRGVDLVIDSLGADVLERSFDALCRFGRLINIGEAAGQPAFDIRKKLYQRSTSMAGFELVHACHGSRGWRTGVRKVVDAVVSGRLAIRIDRELPLTEIGQAQALLESRGTQGKLVLRVAA
jgi:NADPH:quinone reductase